MSGKVSMPYKIRVKCLICGDETTHEYEKGAKATDNGEGVYVVVSRTIGHNTLFKPTCKDCERIQVEDARDRVARFTKLMEVLDPEDD